MGDRQAPAAGSPDAIRPGDPRVGLVLALADDEMVLGHRHSEWTGWAPYLEEDLAFSSIAQDEMAHARVLYELAGPLVDRDVDALALGRSPEEYRHAVICERPNRDWGYSLARHYLYDTADEVRLAALESSSYEELASAVRTIRLEERYHMEHAVSGSPQRGSPGGAAAVRSGPGGGGGGGPGKTFETLPEEERLLQEGSSPDERGAPADVAGTGGERARGRLAGLGVGRACPGRRRDGPDLRRRDRVRPHALGAGHRAARRPWRVHVGGFTGDGGRRGRHTEDFAELWDEMTGLYRAMPGARW